MDGTGPPDEAARRPSSEDYATARVNAVARSRASTKPKGVDPTTSEVDYTLDELEFLRAIQRYQADTGRKFPTCRELLGILVSLGYRKVDAPDAEPPCPS